jgi:hypothetical protein
MRFDDVFAAIDARPFRPFKIELVNGRMIDVSHPENIVVFPTRQRVHHFEVYQDGTYEMSLIWPEGFVGLVYPESATPPSA